VTGRHVLEHKGKTVILADATQATIEEGIAALAVIRQLAAKHSPGTALVLTDVTDFVFDDRASKAVLTTAAANKPYVKASVLVGIQGLKKIVVMTLTRVTGRSFVCFDDRVSALDWLVEQ